MKENYGAIIVTTAKDLERVIKNINKTIERLPAKHITFVGNEDVKKLVDSLNDQKSFAFFNEEDIIAFDDVHRIMKDLLHSDNVPRGVTGWYYQQFLKMKYCEFSEEDYYLSWDGDTIPCKAFSMFDTEGKPYFDLKYEYHEEYFITLNKLLGLSKVIGKSFISEHMLFNKEIMKALIKDIESNDSIPGKTFYEKILRAIRPDQIVSNSFSEFETYGTYVAVKYPNMYKIKDWHSLRYGSMYFKVNEMTDEDYEWLSRDFDAISFEKNQNYEPDFAALFSNPEYRSKLSARQILEAIQAESTEGMNEVWEEPSRESGNDVTLDETLDVAEDDEFLFFNYLGDNLSKTNVDQAYLCYENAAFLCPEGDVKNYLLNKKDTFAKENAVTVKPASIVIVSYNNIYMMKNCIANIRKYCAPGSYETIVVDNASTDGVEKWLSNVDNIKLKLSSENLGFPKGCNEGIELSTPDNDIFLLNNDTRMTHNALFFLRMGLYEDENVGAVGAVSNYSGFEQMLDIKFDTPREYVEYGRINNVYMKNPYEEKNKLNGFAMLIKREALNKAGNLDEGFSPGYFEDDDISMRIHRLGYRLTICHNSFIYHVGSQSFNKREGLSELFEINHQKMTEKWGYDTLSYSVVTKEENAMMEEINRKTGDFFRVLEINGGAGNMISRIKYRFPNAFTVALETNAEIIKDSVSSLPVLKCNWKTDEIPFPEKSFDYILFNDRMGEAPKDEELNSRLSKYLSENGVLIRTHL